MSRRWCELWCAAGRHRRRLQDGVRGRTTAGWSEKAGGDKKDDDKNDLYRTL